MKSSDKINIIIAFVIAFVAAASFILGIYIQWYIQNPPSPVGLVIEGNKRFDSGEYKKAVKYYEKALRSYESDASTWKMKAFALFNFWIANESVSIKRNKPPYSYAKELINHYDLRDQPTDKNQDYLERSLQCFKNAIYYNPKDPETWLYKGIVCLYLSSSLTVNPIEDFDETLTLIDSLPHNQKLYPPLRDIKSCALYGKSIAYSKIE